LGTILQSGDPVSVRALKDDC